jgi:hypothetical protein
MEKLFDDFPLRRDRGTMRPACKDCTRASQQAWRKRRPDYERDRYQRTKTETRERHLIRKYGVSLDAYDQMLKAQEGKCAICCRTEDTQHNRVFHVDHCHKTGAVRGLLCRGCNHVLGHVCDDPSVLQKAIEYLSPQIPEMIGRAILQSMEDAA